MGSVGPAVQSSSTKSHSGSNRILASGSIKTSGSGHYSIGTSSSIYPYSSEVIDLNQALLDKIYSLEEKDVEILRMEIRDLLPRISRFQITPEFNFKFTKSTNEIEVKYSGLDLAAITKIRTHVLAFRPLNGLETMLKESFGTRD